MDNSTPTQSFAFRFHGKGSEFFRIWIVNIALTVLTLGIYSAWAKVRTSRYFYEHTLLDQGRFRYLANPIAILKGRAIAVAAFVLYSVLTGIPLIGLIVILLLMVLTPWVIIRAIRFNARVSAFRNIRFDFNGPLGEAVFLFVLGPLLATLTLGIATPWLTYRYHLFYVQHHTLGKAQFAFHARLKDYYATYAKALLIVLGSLITVAMLTYAAFPNIVQQGLLLVETARMEQSNDDDLASEEEDPPVESDASPTDTATPESIDQVSEGNPFEPTPETEATVTADDKTNELPADILDDEDIELPDSAWLTMMPVFVFAGLWLLFFTVGAYLKATLANLLWNNTTLGTFRFESRLRWGKMLWIQLSNLVAIVVTLGLFIPWAKVRMAHYRADSLTLMGTSGLDGFVAERVAEGSAMGEEVSEVFDLDIGGV
jgi:uncharacterized membrane protein YjgN (DUF898 family)